MLLKKGTRQRRGKTRLQPRVHKEAGLRRAAPRWAPAWPGARVGGRDGRPACLPQGPGSSRQARTATDGGLHGFGPHSQ